VQAQQAASSPYHLLVDCCYILGHTVLQLLHIADKSAAVLLHHTGQQERGRLCVLCAFCLSSHVVAFFEEC
jgi:hypothetical protein